MQVNYSKQAKVAGISILPWPRVGLGRWFTNYRIASLYNWGTQDLTNMPELFSLTDIAPHVKLPKQTTPSLLDNELFQQLLVKNFNGYDLLPYRSVLPPPIITSSGCKFLGNDKDLVGKLENKARFRELTADERLPFPKYRIVERAAITSDMAGLKDLLNGAESVILQDEQLRGGQGTFAIRDLSDLQIALAYLHKASSGTRIVISEHIINAHERTTQACVTRYGVFVGPLQKQIVGNSLLSNMQAIGTGRYGGGEISAKDPCYGAYDTMLSLTIRIGKLIQRMGYRGVFGIDWLIHESGQVFLIELNPRLTGITPLLTMRYRDGQDIPFMLLHVLELADMEYSITDTYVNPLPADGGLLAVHSWRSKPTHLVSFPKPGLYDLGLKERIAPSVYFDDSRNNPQLLVQPVTFGPTHVVKPGAQIGILMTNTAVLDEHDNLTPTIVDTVRWLQSEMKLQEK